MSGKTKPENSELEAAWIRELAGILKETELTEIEIERDDFRIRVARAAAPSAAYVAAPPAPAQDTSAAAPETPAGVDAAKAADHPGAVASPMVGTVYRAPAPGAKPFVEVGDRVAKGQTLMIVEAMKTMNPIQAPRAGVVAEILVDDAQPVEFGDVLLIVN